ncbi:MAG: hypothetical protein HOY79_01475 [Streptomyces sp.]|nr:hypothetical protein [Streptomyces sp.]
MPPLWAANATAGSQWVTSFTLTNDDGTLMSIVGKSFEFVVRASATDTSPTPLAKVTSSSATAAGYITVSTATSSLQVVLSPTATSGIPPTGSWHSLWLDPGLPDATLHLSGPFYCQAAPAP